MITQPKMPTYSGMGTARRSRAGALIAISLLVLISPAVGRMATAPIFTLSIRPDIPLAGDPVTVSVTPTNFDVASSTFSWYRDNNFLPEASGVGRSSVTLATNPGTTEIVQVKVVITAGPEFESGEQSATFYTIPSFAAQQEMLSELASDFTLEASDLNPAPGQPVEVSVITFAFDKSQARYEWYINGAFEKGKSGTGRTEITVATGREGEAQTVRVDVTTPAGLQRSKSISVTPATASLYWWADTEIPYWYKGKALPTLNARVQVTAVVNGRSASNLNYKWEFNGSVMAQSSGVGKSTFAFPLAFPVEEQVAVTLRDIAGTFSKTVSTGVRALAPRVAMYALKPLRGIVSENAVQEFSAPSGDSYDFIAAPFFFPKQTRLTYAWNLNGQEIVGAPPDPWRFTLTSNPNTPALDRLSISVADPTGREIRATTGITVQLR